MPNRYFPTLTIPFIHDASTSPPDKERTPSDVVESGVTTGTGAHVDVNEPSCSSRRDPDIHLVDFIDLGHDDGRSDGEACIETDNFEYHGAAISPHRDDDHSSRRQLLQRDHFEREIERDQRRRERLERRDRRRSDAQQQRRNAAPPGGGDVDDRLERSHNPDAVLRIAGNLPRGSRHHRIRSELSTQDRVGARRGNGYVADHPGALRRFLAGPLNGTALAIYFVLLPYVVVVKWNLSIQAGDGRLIRVLLSVLGVFWIIFLTQVATNVWRIRRGRTAHWNGSAWLAGLVVALLPFLTSTSSGASVRATTSSANSITTIPARNPSRQMSLNREAPTPCHGRPGPASPYVGIPLALMAKRRSDLLRQYQFDDLDLDVDETIDLLRGLNPELITTLRALIDDRSCGVIEFRDDKRARDVATNDDPVLACVLGPTNDGTLIGFAREGGRLPIRAAWGIEDLRVEVVALHQGKIVLTSNHAELLRALATRSGRQTLVVYLGAASDLDSELAACSITVSPYDTMRSSHGDASWGLAANPQSSAGSRGIRINLLRSDPQVTGLCEPFVPTLRRRSLEMLAYLALHRHEPVTGDRLRSRVLAHSDVDASLRTLANTASAVRRSVGSDDAGLRLHAVTSSGLYVTHGITSDVEIFSTLVKRAHQLPSRDAAALAHQALSLVTGEPLASALRGFEWFLAEGHGARLSRDGEWAALALHHEAVQHDKFDLAFWALQQGLLIDPYSDVLLETIARVPRLREFGGDRAGLTQDQSVGPSRTVAMSWSLHGFSNKVTE